MNSVQSIMRAAHNEAAAMGFATSVAGFRIVSKTQRSSPRTQSWMIVCPVLVNLGELGMMIPEIRLLQAVIALADELNFSRAAERLRISQSTLSRRIVEVEDLLGQRLFDRTHQFVDLTEPGRHFVREAKNALLHAERAMLHAAEISHGVTEILNLGQSAYVDPYLVHALLAIQLPLFPRLKFKHSSNYSHELSHLVALGKLDMALVTAVPHNPKVDLLLLADSPIYIALRRDSTLCKHAELRLQHLAEADWILPARHVNPNLHDMIMNASAESRVKVPEIHYVMTPEEAYILIQAHRGVAFMTRHCAWEIARDGVTMRPLADERIRLQTNLATSAENKSRLVAEFVRAAGRKLVNVRPPQQARLPRAC